MPAAAQTGQNVTLGWIFLALLALQCGLQPVFTKAFVGGEVNKTMLVLSCEVFKFWAAAIMLLQSGDTSQVVSSWTVGGSLAAAGIPAGIYAVQNLLIWNAYDHVDGLTFNLVNQSKTLFTAVFVWFLLKRGQTKEQLLGLLLLFAAAVLLSIPTTESKKRNSFLLGILPIMGASALSGLAGALSQRSLQGTGKRNSFLFTMELCVFTVLVLIIGEAARGNVYTFHDPFHGWKAMTIVPVVTQGTGGILVGQVIRHLGGVQKGFGMIFGILITGFVQSLQMWALPEIKLWLGLGLVVSGTAIHTHYSASPSKPKPEIKES